ncbi:GAF and ANTAR domain-containing protein [Streptomonospora sediminis]
MADGENLSHVFARIARDLLDQESVQTTLDGIARLAASEVEGADWAALSIVEAGGAVKSPAASGPVAVRIDRIQYESGEGPCLSAIWEHDVFAIDDMATETRWPGFVAQVRELDVHSMLSFRLFTHRDTLGAMNLYACEPRAFTRASRDEGALLATHAAVALASAQEEENLRSALSSRQHIGEATGILMERYKIPSHRAFGLLAQASQNLNVKVRDLAQQLVETGEWPREGRSG